MKLRSVIPWGAVAAVLLCCGRAHADDVIYTSLDPPGAVQSTASGVNNLGQVVGSYRDGASGPELGFLYSNGQFTTINVPGSTATYANGINDLGDIVGSYITSTTLSGGVTVNTSHGFLYDGSTYQTIDLPGASDTELRGINDNGEIVGEAVPPGPLEAFTYSNGAFQIIGPSDSQLTEAYGINNLGQVVGYYRGPGVGFDGFIDDNGTYQTLDFPGGFDTELFGINNNGDIVGYTVSPGTDFEYSNGTYTEVFGPTGENADVQGINDHGQTVGLYGIDPAESFGYGGYLATPAPEPGSLSLLWSGLGAASVLAFRRKRAP
ncbi:MAG TPA: PEP-CTERM sorting domain-containing protein [Candidatus Acidoferrum sp.]|nr:PEP-CTERM sorting domain-containing protein [Candidatus Acidoferrum sp.]